MAAKKRPKDGTRRILPGSPPARRRDREDGYDNQRGREYAGTARPERSRGNSEPPGKRENNRPAGKRAAPPRGERPEGTKGRPRKARPNREDVQNHSSRGQRGGPPRQNREAARKPEAKRREKQAPRGRTGWKILLWILVGIAAASGLGFLAVSLFETKKITVTGNQYCSEQEIIDWLLADKYSGNSLYLLWKYNQNDVKQLPAIEETKIGLKSMEEVRVHVKEKTFSGRIDYQEAFLYFDRDGIASLVTDTLIEGVPYIEGIEISLEEVRLGKGLPVTDGQILEELESLMPLLEKQGLSPDKISCAGTDLTLHFGGVRVQIGNSQFADRLAQVPPILEKLAELYADQTGVLHLENYDVSGSSIRFVPDTAAQPQPESEPEAQPADP